MLLDATENGVVLLVGLGVKIGHTFVRIGASCDAEERPARREEGAHLSTSNPRTQQGRPRHPQGGRASSPSRGRKRKTKKEDAAAASAFDLVAEEATWAEDAAIREAIARSLNDLVPADNALPMDAALAWSRHDWEREEAEQQRHLLDLATAPPRHRTRPRRTAHQAGGQQRG
jgi:hypothetical protein